MKTVISQNKKITAAFIGDSITYGYPYGPEYSWVGLLQKNMHCNLEAINLGINGDSLMDMHRRFIRDVLRHKPTFVHILGGSNDAWLNNDPVHSQKAVDEMVGQCRDAGIKPVIGLTTPLCHNPSGGSSFIPFGAEEMMLWLDQFREWLKYYTSSKSIPLIDYYTALCLPGTGRGNPVYFYDECHLNHRGNKVMAQLTGRKLKEIINSIN
ncbi:GDSL-type esterase/lipase family protein [Desulfotruncus alcoholivorax]|uniref:GDSL-type esterase/lipase family protein n=1 Tax=Desulfotruncus alcoholivorax TaxID=265477 RepID=UPI0004290D75|nr:GDSL-type esterase/lipase family protein [Desulfotruncus alcoholivorax]